MENPFPPFDPDGEVAGGQKSDARGARLRDIPLRAIFPSLLTLLAICSGLTAIRLAIELRLELAIAAIILAAFLDGIDGRVARFLKSTSRFGAQLDSLADFVNFGVAPALVLYFTLLKGALSLGWIAALVYAICACLRLARFNAMLDAPERPKWQSNFFVGVPAPAGAMLVLAPIYLVLLGAGDALPFALASAAYVIAIGFLMVSRLPTWSGKDVTKRIPRAHVLPFLIALVVFVALLLSYPWQTLLACVAAYFASLPFGWRDWQARMATDENTPEAAVSINDS